MTFDARAEARQYISDGWAVVPLVPGAKRANTSWQKRTYKTDDFEQHSGIAGKCGEPSGWRVDVDLDCAEAIAAAAMLLPTTALRHGRPSKLESHYWYLSEGAKTAQFTDVKADDGTSSMLVELRSTGGYTVLPPSTHPSGEVFDWSVNASADALVITPDNLYSAVRNVALAAILARHWPGHGARHVAVGHMAGFLCQGGLDGKAVIEIIRSAATVAGDGTDVHDCVALAASTVTKYRQGERVTGAPKLVNELGEALVAKMRSWLKLADLDAIEEMNSRHFFVRAGSKSVIGREDDPAGVVLQPVRELYSEYANRRVQTGEDKNGNATYEPLFKAWLKSPNRRQYLGGIVMAPPPQRAADNQYNLWRGFAVEEREGCCDRVLAHIREVICSGNEEHYNYILDWCAYCVQQPGERPGVAVVLRGKQGTGKGTFAELLERIFGRRHFAHLDRTKELVEWNSLVSGKVVVFADEAFFAGDKQNIGALKRIISEPTIRISRKHLDSVEERNCIHLLMATNEDWAIPAGLDERRFFALHVSEVHKQDEAYFSALRCEMGEGGVEAFLFQMKRRLVTADRIRNRPRTEELRTQQNQSLDSHFKWWRECLHDGEISVLINPWDSWVPVHTLYSTYKEWVREYRTRFLDRYEFGRRMSRLFSAAPSQMRRVGHGQRERSVRLRALGDARSIFDAELGTKEDWDTPIVRVPPF